MHDWLSLAIKRKTYIQTTQWIKCSVDLYSEVRTDTLPRICMILEEIMPKNWRPCGIWAYSVVRCITSIFAVFVYSRIIFIEWRLPSAKFDFMRINYNFVTMVGLTNDERCLIHNLHVEKLQGSERITKMFSDKWAHFNCKQLTANVKVVQTVKICVPLQFIWHYIDAVERFTFLAHPVYHIIKDLKESTFIYKVQIPYFTRVSNTCEQTCCYVLLTAFLINCYSLSNKYGTLV